MLEGEPDPNDPRTSECQAPPNHDYTAFLKADALKGTRIGVPRAGFYEAREFPGKARPFAGLKPDELASMEAAIAAIKAAGAEIIDPADLPEHVAADAREESDLTQHLRAAVRRQGRRRPVLDRASLRHEARFQPVAGDAGDFGADEVPDRVARMEPRS